MASPLAVHFWVLTYRWRLSLLLHWKSNEKIAGKPFNLWFLKFKRKLQFRLIRNLFVVVHKFIGKNGSQNQCGIAILNYDTIITFLLIYCFCIKIQPKLCSDLREIIFSNKSLIHLFYFASFFSLRIYFNKYLLNNGWRVSNNSKTKTKT